MKKIFTLKILLFCIAMLTLSGTFAQTWTVYDGSVIPTAATPAWTAGDIGTPAAVYTVEDDAIIAGNKLLHETTSATADKQSFKLNIAQPTAATWLIRVKAGNNPVSTEFEFNSISSGAAKTRCYFRLVNNAKGGYIATNYLATNVIYPLDTTLNVKNFHTYRITVENGLDYKIYVDENATAAITGTGSTTTNAQFLRFGDVGGNFTEGFIDWMAWDATGAFLPGTTLPTGVVVDGGSVKVNGLITKNHSIHANPVTHAVVIENATDIKSYEIVGLSGILISKGKNQNSKLSVNVNYLKPGIYFVKLYTGSKSEQIKFIKK